MHFLWAFLGGRGRGDRRPFGFASVRRQEPVLLSPMISPVCNHKHVRAYVCLYLHSVRRQPARVGVWRGRAGTAGFAGRRSEPHARLRPV